jgi:DNA-binding CsgD family transcriptional regulator
VDAVARQRIVAEIRRHVRFQWYVWLITDPRTSVGAAPVADPPPALVARLPALIRMKYLTTVNRWTTVDGVGFLHEATAGDLGQSLVWRSLLHEHSIVDIATLVFRDRFGCWGFLDLWRTDQPFSRRDAAYLAGRIAPVTEALRSAVAATFASAAVPAAPGPVVLLLSASLHVLGVTPATGSYLRALVPPPLGREPIPAGAYNVAAQLLAVEAGVDLNPPRARVHLVDGHWLSLRAARLGGGPKDPIAVTIEEASPAERLDLFARSAGLSPRETELLGLLAGGHDTRHLASALVLSEHTIQDHLKSVFAKTGTRTRRELLSRAFGATFP